MVIHDRVFADVALDVHHHGVADLGRPFDIHQGSQLLAALVDHLVYVGIGHVDLGFLKAQTLIVAQVHRRLERHGQLEGQRFHLDVYQRSLSVGLDVLRFESLAVDFLAQIVQDFIQQGFASVTA